MARKFKLPAVGALVGFAYGFGVRLLASLRMSGWDVMTIGFLVFMPFVMGCLTVYFVEVRRHQPLWMWLVLPWAPLAGALGAALLVTLEGLICVVMFLPLALMLSSFGGVLGGFAGRGLRTRRRSGVTMACVRGAAVSDRDVGAAGFLSARFAAGGKRDRHRGAVRRGVAEHRARAGNP
jgi:hypothetical protein